MQTATDLEPGESVAKGRSNEGTPRPFVFSVDDDYSDRSRGRVARRYRNGCRHRSGTVPASRRLSRGASRADELQRVVDRRADSFTRIGKGGGSADCPGSASDRTEARRSRYRPETAERCERAGCGRSDRNCHAEHAASRVGIRCIDSDRAGSSLSCQPQGKQQEGE